MIPVRLLVSRKNTSCEKGDGREQMEITPQENAHVPPYTYKKQVVLTPMVGSKPSTGTIQYG